MKKFLFTVAILCLMGISSARVSRPRGIGVILGDRTGLSFKYWNSSKLAADAALSWNDGGLYLHADYLMHFSIASGRAWRLPVYLGLGSSVFLADNSSVGLRIPVGLNYIMTRMPFDFFLEIVPTMGLSDGMGFDTNVFGGLRFFF
ncbi:MAG: hypothetical protein ACLFQK_01705 [Fibrobacterota bacterium]